MVMILVKGGGLRPLMQDGPVIQPFRFIRTGVGSVSHVHGVVGWDCLPVYCV